MFKFDYLSFNRISFIFQWCFVPLYSCHQAIKTEGNVLYGTEHIFSYDSDTWASKAGKVEKQQKNNRRGADPISTAHLALQNLLQTLGALRVKALMLI